MALSKNSKLAFALVFATLLTACGRGVPTLESSSSAAKAGTPTAARPAAPTEIYKEEQPEQAEVDPIEGPVNLPSIPKAPTTPVEPSQMQVRALATTITVNPAPGMGAVKATVIRAKLTWTPVKGASGYKIYQLAVREGQAEGDKGKLALKTPNWLPVAIVGGGMGFANLNVGQEYVYTVEATDRGGNVIATGQDNCAPLAPLDLPYLQAPGVNEMKVGQTPFFRWTDVRGADGYYVEVFGTIRNTIPALPMWRGFRANAEAMNMMYGQQIDVFEGTRPMQWSLPLNIGSRYAWTVAAIRTDTHNMQNAKAIAKSTAPIGYFVP